MPKFTIDSVEYNTEDLNEHAQKLYSSLQYAMVQLKKIESEAEIYKIAHQTIANELRQELAK
ncbi:DUF6447 family protein [Paracoccaceae bacterium]|nr:DUF6447 family protein [Paracoccaceae bacterium]